VQVLLGILKTERVIEPFCFEAQTPFIENPVGSGFNAWNAVVAEFLKAERAHFQAIERLNDVRDRILQIPLLRARVGAAILKQLPQMLDLQRRFLLRAEAIGHESVQNQDWALFFIDWSRNYSRYKDYALRTATELEHLQSLVKLGRRPRSNLGVGGILAEGESRRKLRHLLPALEDAIFLLPLPVTRIADYLAFLQVCGFSGPRVFFFQG
jgi:hypothetical protein